MASSKQGHRMHKKAERKSRYSLPHPPIFRFARSTLFFVCVCIHARLQCQALANWADACCRGAGAAGTGHHFCHQHVPLGAGRLAGLEQASFPAKS
eukprot:1030155-Rhodomonas_salina.2